MSPSDDDATQLALLTSKVTNLETAVDSLRRYLEEDRRIQASVDRLGTGVDELKMVMGRVEETARRVTRVEQTKASQEDVHKATTAVAADSAQQRKRVLREVRGFAFVAALFLSIVVVGFFAFREQDQARQRDVVRSSHSACKAGNARVDHIEKLLRDLTVNARPESQARIEKALVPFRATKRDCDRLYPVK